jgi:hypothetical protein
VGLTLGAMLPYGPAGAVHAVLEWGDLSRQAAPFGTVGTQSLQGFGTFFGWSPAAVGALGVACLAAATIALRRSAAAPLAGIGVAGLVAVLFSPIAWLYYHTLALPGWLVAQTREPAGSAPRRVVLWGAALLTSGALTFGLYPRWLWFISAANYTWGSLLLLAVLVYDRFARPRPVPPPS